MSVYTEDNLVQKTTATLRVFDFDDQDKKHFLCVRELWLRGSLSRRRADVVGFVNGVPLLKFIAEMSDEEVSYRCERSVPAGVTGENGHEVWVSDVSDGCFSAIVAFRKLLGI